MSSVGRRYAKAIYSLATDEKAEERIGAELAQMAQIWAESSVLRTVFENPQIHSDARKKVVSEIADRAGFTLTVKNSLLLLAERMRLRDLADINRSYHTILEERSGTVHAEVTTAAHLSDAYFAELTKSLEKVLGKKVKIAHKVEPALIGGVVTKVGDKIFDGSLRNRLVELKDELLSQ